MKVRDEAFRYYFYFIQERMKIFWKRYEGLQDNLTNDPIFSKYKFTNVYRAQDRVSQYLIKHVISGQEKQFPGKDTLLRILVFKIFNNINTWNYLEDKLGEISTKTFDVELISALLDERIKQVPIFNPAYMMTSSHSGYNMYARKHEKWLRMIKKELLYAGGFEKILEAKSLGRVYNILLQCPFIGEFLAYQYAIDFNYSSVMNFDENSFVKAGIGAIRGVKKCFTAMGHYTYEDCIKYTQDNFENYQHKYGMTEFKNLFGRQPKLIDLQNCFCQTDKYLRVAMPELLIGNVRIKQKFTQAGEPIQFVFPEKWGINGYLKRDDWGKAE